MYFFEKTDLFVDSTPFKKRYGVFQNKEDKIVLHAWYDCHLGCAQLDSEKTWRL